MCKKNTKSVINVFNVNNLPCKYVTFDGQQPISIKFRAVPGSPLECVL